MKFVYEFIGTFFLMLTVGMTVINTNHPEYWAPLAIGSILAVMIFAGGHVSGGHYNPAVSLAVLLRKKISLKTMLGYWIVQLAGAAIAALITIYLKGESSSAPLHRIHWKRFWQSFFLPLCPMLCCFEYQATVKTTLGKLLFRPGNWIYSSCRSLCCWSNIRGSI